MWHSAARQIVAACKSTGSGAYARIATMQESANFIHLKRLYTLRYIAIIGQVLALLITQYGLNIELPLLAVSLIVIQVVLFNGFVWLRLQQPKAVTENEIFIHLSFDVLALALLLYFTGGASNPFVLLFLFPLTITVTILPVRYAWLLVALTVGSYSLLMFNYQPLPMGHEMSHGMDHSMHSGMEETSEYDLHLMGMWLAFIVNACLIAYFVYGMGLTIRQQQSELSSAREQSIRDEQLVLLGTLAASTAHELGTPLATMSLLADEIEFENKSGNTQIAADLESLKNQISRCKTALSDLSASVDASSDLFGNNQQPVCVYLNSIINEVSELNKTTVVELCCDLTAEYSLVTDRTLTLALVNIIENALEASPEFVRINVELVDKNIVVSIIDRGPGLTEEALANIGEQPYSDKELGLGLGLYLAYSAIRRRQGSISQTNRSDSQGSETQISIPVIYTAQT